MERDRYCAEPWNIPCITRSARFYEAKKAHKKCVLYIYELADTSTFRYRAYNVMQATLKSTSWFAQYFFSDTESEQIIRLLPQSDLVVIVRVKWSDVVDKIIYSAHSIGKTVIFDCDDLVFDMDYLPLMINSIGLDIRQKDNAEILYSYWFSYFSRLFFTAQKCDAFISTNDFLRRKFEDKFGRPCFSIRNSLNQEQIDISEELTQCKEKHPLYQSFTIGYFSGSPSHAQDFCVIAPEIARFLSENENSKLLVVGFMDFPSYLQPFLEKKRIEFHPLVDFLELERLIAGVHVNVVPLVENDFTNCKSELKYFESAIVDTITMASPSYTYSRAIKDGETGFLCKPGQWYTQLNRIYHKEVDCSLIAKNAHKDALLRYSGQTFLSEVENCFEQLLRLKITPQKLKRID